MATEEDQVIRYSKLGNNGLVLSLRISNFKFRISLVCSLVASLLLVICWSCVSRGPVLKEGDRVTIAGNGIGIAGILYRPDKSTGSAPGIIVLHGWSQYDTNGAETVAIPAWLFSREGYVALALSLRGWPDTGGKDDCGGKQPHDVAAAINWLSRQPGVNPGKIGLVGFSQGGQVALLAAALTDKVKAVVAYFPVTDIDRWAKTSDNSGVSEGYIPEVCIRGSESKSKSPVYVAGKIGAAVLLVHGDQDKLVPMEQSMEMAKALMSRTKKVQLYIVRGGTHLTRAGDDGWQEAWDLTKKFLQQELMSP